MQSPRLIHNKYTPLNYDIVEKTWRRVRIIVFIDGDIDDLSIEASGEKLVIKTFNHEFLETGYAIIRVGFKINRYEYRLVNGVLTIEVYGKRFLLF